MSKSFKEITEQLKKVLNELAFPRKKAVFEITNLCIPYTKHIIKLSIFGTDLKHEYDVPKWKDEIFNFIDQACQYYDLSGNKKLKPKDYTEHFFFGLLETVEETEVHIKRILKDFPRQGYELPDVNKLNYKQLYECHYAFVQEILKQFPEVSYESVMELLDKLIIGKAL